MLKPISRRTFAKASLHGAAALASCATLGAATAQSGRSKLRLGGPVFQEYEDPGEWARALKELGYNAAYCPVGPDAPGDLIRAYEKEAKKSNIVIAEVGVWVNLMDADQEKRRANMQRVTEGLALADEIGARCCVDIAGSFNTESWFGPHPDNLSERFFDAAVENARKIVDGVKPKRAKFGYEMMGWAIPDSPDSNLRLLKAVDRDAFAVHLDPCNLINSPKRFYENTAVINECFDKLGPWIVSCHAKDLTWDVEMNVHFREVQPGTGSIDCKTYLKRLAALPQEVPLMAEHLQTAQEYRQAAEYIRSVAQENGLSFA
jgi:sugar phosphate isomerase/epimerase